MPSCCVADVTMSPSLLRAPDVLPCSVPSHSPHPSLFSLPRLFPPLSFLSIRDSQTSIQRLQTSHPSHTHTTHTRHFPIALQTPSHNSHSYTQHSTSVPASSLLLWPFPSTLSSPCAFPFVPYSPTRPLVIYYSSDANGPHTRGDIPNTSPRGMMGQLSPFVF